MVTPSTDWSTHQLAEFLASVSSFKDEASATRGAIERAAEAFEAEVGAIVRDGSVVASVGFPANRVPVDNLAALVDGVRQNTVIPGVGVCSVAVVPLEDGQPARLILARGGESEFTLQERNLLRGMARVLALTLAMLERQKLLERLSKIQRSISHRAPLQEVLDAITAGASELLGVEVAGLRVVDPADPSYCLIASASGVPENLLESIGRTPIGEGAGGRAIAEGGMVIVDEYEHEPGMVPGFAAQHLQTAMAAPVYENGVIGGSLVVASYKSGRRFSESEQDALLALAEHASLALTDAKTVDAMREAQRSKDMFLAMVSHELKTPLTVIMGVLRTVQVHGADLPEELTNEMLDSGWARGKELERLIDRLLQGARAELAGSEEEVRLPVLLREAMRGFEHSRRVAVNDAPDIPVRLDRPAVLEVLGILLENAVAHSPGDGEVTMDARLEGSELALSVSNPGSLPDELDRESLFLPFQRGSAVRSSGVGLGLYIAGRVAESIHGRMEAQSGGGEVRFTLRVPVRETVPVVGQASLP
jgi:signal transduction histidine kinase